MPFDEDYGLATLEAFLAAKPVVTARDSGGTLEFVRDGVNGFVVEPDPAAIARRDRARSTPIAGSPRRSARRPRRWRRTISWDTVIDRLLSHG